MDAAFVAKVHALTAELERGPQEQVAGQLNLNLAMLDIRRWELFKCLDESSPIGYKNSLAAFS